MIELSWEGGVPSLNWGVITPPKWGGGVVKISLTESLSARSLAITATHNITAATVI